MAESNAQRQQKFREVKRAQGAVRVSAWVSKAAAARLEQLINPKLGMPTREKVIETLLENA